MPSLETFQLAVWSHQPRELSLTICSVVIDLVLEIITRPHIFPAVSFEQLTRESEHTIVRLLSGLVDDIHVNGDAQFYDPRTGIALQIHGHIKCLRRCTKCHSDRLAGPGDVPPAMFLDQVVQP